MGKKPQMTREQRRERSKAIAEYSEEHGIEETAKHFGVSIGKVYRDRIDNGFTSTCHSKARERRKLIAMHAAEHGKSAAVIKYEVSLSTVNAACYENGVVSPVTPRTAGLRTLRIVKRLLDGESQAKIADDIQTSRQYVNIIKSRAESAGFVFENEDTGKSLNLNVRVRFRMTSRGVEVAKSYFQQFGQTIPNATFRTDKPDEECEEQLHELFRIFGGDAMQPHAMGSPIYDLKFV